MQSHLGVEMGHDIGFADLLDNYDAVLLGTAAHTFVDGELPGRDLEGVHDALPFLIANANRLLDDLPVSAGLDLNGKHVVLDGGDIGMDCNRTAIRLGAASVICVYRRDEAGMPGSRREEGVTFLFQRQPPLTHGYSPAATTCVVLTWWCAPGTMVAKRPV